ncbi:MAG TPA: Na+/H+ antiporter subunit E [Vicinamibacteria bacterium]|nr:Na+/H+ antiporter subunit E [Vicinamibacteria bacterium]
MDPRIAAVHTETILDMPRRNTAIWTLALFALWVLLSGKLDALHLLMGAASAAVVAAVTRRLLALPPAIGPGATAPLRPGVVLRFALFLPWLVLQIVQSSFQVAWVILQPRLPIDPRVLRLPTHLPHPLARLTLANSITLTPGTVTLDVDGDEFLVHALNEASAHSLLPGGEEGDMQRRIGRVFGAGEDGAA